MSALVAYLFGLATIPAVLAVLALGEHLWHEYRHHHRLLRHVTNAEGHWDHMHRYPNLWPLWLTVLVLHPRRVRRCEASGGEL